MADIEWIKLHLKTFRTSRKISAIERMKNGDTIIVIWFKLLCMAGEINDGGAIYVTPKIPFDEISLADELKKPVAAVRTAIKVFEEHDMVFKDGAGFIQISNWEKYQSVDRMTEIREQNRLRKQRQREMEKMSRDCHVTVTGDVTECHAIEREREKEGEKEGDKEIMSERENAPARKDLRCYGRFENVMLTRAEHDQLIEIYGKSCGEELIESFSMKLKSKGYKYDDHYSTILLWAQKDGKKPVAEANGGGSFDTDEFFEAALRRARG